MARTKGQASRYGELDQLVNRLGVDIARSTLMSSNVNLRTAYESWVAKKWLPFFRSDIGDDAAFKLLLSRFWLYWNEWADYLGPQRQVGNISPVTLSQIRLLETKSPIDTMDEERRQYITRAVACCAAGALLVLMLRKG